MTKLWILSDLHLEGVRYPDAYRPRVPDAHVLVSAGDAWSEHPDKGIAALRRIAGDIPVVAIPGNHCSWGRRIPEAREVARDAARRHGVTWLDDEVAIVGGVRFLGSTLWSDYAVTGTPWPDNGRTGDDVEVGEGYGWKHLRVGDARRMHAAARAFLERELAIHAPVPTVVVTHMAPHPSCVDGTGRPFAVDNSVSDLGHLTDAGAARLWIHGHLHDSSDVIRPGGTRLMRNPAGVRFSNAGFDDGLCVDVT